MKRRIYFIIMLVLLQFSSVNAQQKELKFRNFTQEDGLPSNEAYCVFRDSRNYIWISTDQGVVRFNGLRMEHFALPDNVVFKIREDRQGRIWFFSHTGKLSYFFNEQIYPYKYNDTILKYTKGLLITDAYVSPEGQVQINSSGGDYSNYDISPDGILKRASYFNYGHDSSFIDIRQTGPQSYFARRKSYSQVTRRLSINLKNEKGKLLKTYIGSISPDSYHHIGVVNYDKNIYFFAGKALFRLSHDGIVFQKQFPSDILCIKTAGENLWIGMIKHGALLLNENLDIVDSQHIFRGLSITSITQDYEGGTWFSSLERGVFYLKNILVYNLRGSEALSQPVSRVFNLNDSVLLFTNQDGLHKMQKGKVSMLYPFANDNVSDLARNERGMVFLGGKPANTELLYSAWKVPLHDPLIDTVMVIQSSSEIFFTKSNRAYVLFGHLLRSYDLGQRPAGANLRFIADQSSVGRKEKKDATGVNGNMLFIDSRENAWMGSPTKLYKFNNRLDSISNFMPNEQFFQKGVTHMRQMDNGIYAIGLRSGIILLKDTQVIAHITVADGLLNNSVKFILPQDNKLWIATATGISVIHFQSFSPLRYTITNIGKNEGFSNLSIRQLEPYQGNILAATGNGIYVIEKPGGFLERPPIEIPLFINKITYYKGDTSDISSISVPYSNNRLKISYNAISFNNADEIKYFYRLGNADTMWQELSGTDLLLDNLSPGIYNLELKADIQSLHRSSQVRKLEIIIEEPWWQNAWLKIGGLLILVIGGIVFYKVRVKTITKKANLRTMQKTKMLELEQTALRSQMNPHFIFNSLTSIQQLILSNKAEQANEHLVKFARLIRKTLELSARPYIRLNEEKEYLQEYLVLEQMRIPGEFEFTIAIDERIDIFRTEIPNMMLQPIVENCIRHGIKHLETRKGLITILVELTGTVIRCTITDNGVGRNPTAHSSGNIFFRQKSYGMEIVRKRLELLPGAEERITVPEITDLYDEHGMASGTRVSIQLPYKIITP